VLAGGARENTTALRLAQRKATALVLAEVQHRITTGGGPLVRLDAQHIQNAQRTDRAPGGVGFGLVVAPVAVRVLAGEYLRHQGPLGDGGSGLLYLGITGWLVEKVNQRPVADRGVLRLQQPGDGVGL
jgi:hypothetical protein